jgi:threonine aldolase
MREAMAAAPVGDDVMGEDPSVNELQRRAAVLLGKEAALFVPSGTMANLLAALSQTRPGDTVILHQDAHPYNYESGNLGMVAGVLPRLLGGNCGVLDPEDVRAHIVQSSDHHYSPTTLIAIENTTNRGGGAIYDIGAVAAIGAVARERGVRAHCDGARLFNAVVASGVSAAEYAAHVDTVCFCLSKGLGAPVGSLLAGSAETIDRAHRYRKMLGGGTRQAGILAAAGLYALDHHIDRLAEDHARARRFRDALQGCGGLRFTLPAPTNIVYVDVADAEAFAGRLAELGVLVFATGPARIRAVFHLDISDAGLERAVHAFQSVAAK